MKYNKHEIMKNAWNLVKTYGINLATALRSAWNLAKAMIEAEAAGNEYCGHTKVIANDWAKYGKCRTYISARVYTNAWNLKREIKLGYIDNMTGMLVRA